MRKQVLSITSSVVILFVCSVAHAFDISDFMNQLKNCPIQTDAQMEAKAKYLAGQQCASHSCSSYGYRYDFCDKFSLVTCYKCD
jgi:hypothetical protein